MHLRPARTADLPALMTLARSLDSVNLPCDRGRLAALVEQSRASFAARAPERARYLFVLDAGHVLGCSLLEPGHGRPGEPHLSLAFADHDAQGEPRRLRLRAHERGVTELGGLVVAPDARGQRRPGRQLSLARLLWIAHHPARADGEVLAEMLPALRPDGSSPLWDELGRRRTGLDYRAADRRSAHDKAFLLEAFREPVDLAALSPSVRDQRGRVGPAAREGKHR